MLAAAMSAEIISILSMAGIAIFAGPAATSSTRANATCNGTLRYVPRVGTRQSAVDRRRWEFALKEGDEGWSIERVVAR